MNKSLMGYYTRIQIILCTLQNNVSLDKQLCAVCAKSSFNWCSSKFIQVFAHLPFASAATSLSLVASRLSGSSFFQRRVCSAPSSYEAEKGII